MRFPGFEGEWELRKLGDLATKINSGKTPLGGEAVYSLNGVPFIRSQNVTNGRLQLENPVFIPEVINSKMKNSVVQANDILLNITGASLGRSCVVPSDFNIGNVNQHVCIIRLNKKYNPRFIHPIFSSDKGQTIFNSLQTGSGREGLNFESIKSIKLHIPDSQEQEKIADFLSIIDTRIQTQSKIIEKLETLIKGISEKLFAQSIRFKRGGKLDFPKWETKKLGEILTMGSGKDYKHLGEGTVPVFGTGGLMTYVNSFLYDGETVCIGRKGTIDKPMYYQGKIWTVDTLFFTHSFLNVLPKFIFYVFKAINWKEHNEASGVPSLSKSTIEKIPIKIPSVLEQRKISDLLSAIDEKICVERTLLTNFQKQKEYLLGGLFI